MKGWIVPAAIAAIVLIVAFSPSSHAGRSAADISPGAGSGTGNAASTESGTFTKLSPSFRSPFGLAYDPVNGNLYVANQLSTYLSAVNTTSGEVSGYLRGFRMPYAVAFDAYNGYLVVSNFNETFNYSYSPYSCVVNPSSGVILHTFGSGIAAANSRDGGYYVAYGNRIALVSGQGWKTVAETNVDGRVVVMHFDYRENSLLAVTSNDTLAVVSSSGVLEKAIPLSGDNLTSVSGVEFCTDASGNTVYTVGITNSRGIPLTSVNLESGNITEINSSEAVNKGSLHAGDILYNPHNKLLYILGKQGYGLFIVKPSDGSMVANFSMNDLPNRMAYDPVNHGVYITAGYGEFTTGKLIFMNFTYEPASPARIMNYYRIPAIVSIAVAVILVSVVLLTRRDRNS